MAPERLPARPFAQLSAAAPASAFVDRQRELAAWDAMLDEADDRLPAVIDIAGEPGVGKTALLKMFADRARARGLQVPTEIRGRFRYRPGILLLDDVDRLNSVSSDEVAQLLDRGLGENSVVVVAHRSRQISPRLRFALSAAKAAEIELSGLREGDLGSLGADGLCDPHRYRELRESGGNPEYVKILAAWCTGPGSCAGGLLPAPQLAIPGEAAATWSELVALSDGARKVLRAAGVAGSEFDPELLSEVARLSLDAVLAGIDELLAADLVRPAGFTGQLGFRSLMTRWIVYASTPGGSRFGAHLRALKVMHARGEAADALAVHVERCARVGDLESVHSLIDAARSTAPTCPWTAAYWYSAAQRLLPAGSAHHLLRSELAAELAECGAAANSDADTAADADPSTAAPADHTANLRPVASPQTDPTASAEIGAGLSQLSPRENQVAALVSRGRTNQQIARLLGVSHKTIETHLSRVFNKLDVSSRAEIANLVGRTKGSDAAVGC